MNDLNENHPKLGPFKKGEAIRSNRGRLLLIWEDTPATESTVWVNAPGEAPFPLWRSEIVERLTAAEAIADLPQAQAEAHQDRQAVAPEQSSGSA